MTDMENVEYDVVIVGAGVYGGALYDKLAAVDPKLKVLLIDKDPAKLGKRAGTVGKLAMTSYNHGLIGALLEDGRRYFGLRLVMATGSVPTKLKTSCPGVVYDPEDLKPASKMAQAVVLGGGDDAVEAALKLSKKFKYVYLCSESFELSCKEKSKKKLEAAENVAHLPGCALASCRQDKSGCKATLSTYDTIKCAGVCACVGKSPNASGLTRQMAEFDEKGAIVVGRDGMTTVVPNVYAVGDCCSRPNKTALGAAAKRILKETEER